MWNYTTSWLPPAGRGRQRMRTNVIELQMYKVH